jgi:hypothetical protein
MGSYLLRNSIEPFLYIDLSDLAYVTFTSFFFSFGHVGCAFQILTTFSTLRRL